MVLEADEALLAAGLGGARGLHARLIEREAHRLGAFLGVGDGLVQGLDGEHALLEVGVGGGDGAAGVEHPDCGEWSAWGASWDVGTGDSRVRTSTTGGGLVVPLSMLLALGSSFSLLTLDLFPDAGPATPDLDTERLIGEVMMVEDWVMGVMGVMVEDGRR